MSYALEIRTEETPAAADGFAISGLWMLPILLLTLMFDMFSRHLVKLREMRRTRPMPKDWRSFYPGLRTSEWAIRMVCFEGARQVILGKDLDLGAITFDPEPPESFQPPMPRSALAMHRRLEDLARFHADPEARVRRHAERIRERNCDQLASPRPPALLSLLLSSPFFFFPRAATSTGQRIRAPPWPAGVHSQNSSQTSLPAPRARTRPRAQNPRNPPHGLPRPILVYRPIVSGLPRDTQ